MVAKKTTRADEEKKNGQTSAKSASSRTSRSSKKAAADKEKTEKATEATPASSAKVAKEVELLGLQQMASILRIHPLQLKQMAQTGKVPGVVVDGEWRFNKDLVQEALRRRSLGR